MGKQTEDLKENTVKPSVNATIVFGEENPIPIGVAPTVSEKEIAFKTMHDCGTAAALKKPVEKNGATPPAKTGETAKVAAVKQKMWCPSCQVEIDETVRGWEYAPGQYVTFTDDELSVLKGPEQKVIVISKFVPRNTVTALMVDKNYFLIPNPNIPASYGVLYAVLAETKLAGIGTQSLWGKEHPCAIYADQSFEGRSVLIMQVLRQHEDLVTPDFSATIPASAAKKHLKETVTAMKSELVEADLASKQRALLNTLVQEKLVASETDDLMEELQKSLVPKEKVK